MSIKNLMQIQQENRKLIILANNPEAKSYEEALEMELGLGCIISRYNIGVWGHLATKFYYKLDSFRKNKDTGNYDFIFINYGFESLSKAWVGEDINYTIITKQNLIKELTYTKPEYRGQVQTKIIGKPLTLDKVLIALKSSEDGNDFSIDVNGWLMQLGSSISRWDLTKPTLEQQSEQTQKQINKLLTK